MAQVVKTATRKLPGFKLGQKQVFLPNHVITFLRKEHLPPNEACFQVPLRFTKFDLRDYLWNLYNVEVTKVRAYVKQQPLTRRDDHSRAWYRPQPLKIMTVELAKPFQWPRVPEDLSPWSKELWDRREKEQDSQTERTLQTQRGEIALVSKQPVSEERRQLADLAKKMVSGEVVWKNDVILDSKWDRILQEAKAVGKSE